jgi:uncharacterized protein
MNPGNPESVAAGPFGDWLESMRAVLRGERDAEVPCGDCVGCCVSSYPILLRDSDQVARAIVPEQFLIASPERPGQLFMGYRDDGSCPMFVGGQCSIYADRPQTCRDYDCRIYAAAGMRPAGERSLIAQRVAAWAFTYSNEQERAASEGVLRAAQFIRAHASKFPPGMRAGSPTAAAVLAVKSYGVFLQERDGSTDEAAADRLVSAVIESAHEFDSGFSGGSPENPAADV